MTDFAERSRRYLWTDAFAVWWLVSASAREIGYRASRMTGGARRLGLYGFGSAGHMIAQGAKHRSGMGG